MEFIKSNNFDNKIAKGYSLVDFTASWCGPCKMLAPIFEKLGTNNNKANFYKVDIDENKDLAGKYDISSVPSVILFKDGQKLDMFVGFKTENQIIDFLNKHVA